MIYSNGDVYTGQFKNGMANGYGTFIKKDKSFYEG